MYLQILLSLKEAPGCDASLHLSLATCFLLSEAGVVSTHTHTHFTHFQFSHHTNNTHDTFYSSFFVHFVGYLTFLPE